MLINYDSPQLVANTSGLNWWPGLEILFFLFSHNSCVQYFYNSQNQEYMYWDTVSKSYVPVPGGNSTAAQPVTMTAEDQAILSNPAADAPLEMKKPSETSPTTGALPLLPVSVTDASSESVPASTAASDKKEDDDLAKKDKEKDNKEEKPRSLAAVKVALHLFYQCTEC